LRDLHLSDAHGPPLQSEEERGVVAFDLIERALRILCLDR
jgi:hypothetical protein